MKRTLLLVTLLCLPASAARAQNWPQFRGPRAAGVADGKKTPIAWDASKSSNVAWKTPIPGLSHASPVVWGDKIFLVTAISAEAKPTYSAKNRGIGLARDDARHAWKVYALDKATGRILWERTAHEGVPRAQRHVKATQANSTPATDGRTVVALLGSEGLFAYDTSGKLLWKQDLGVLNPGLWDDPTSSWGHASSPVIHGGLVFVQADGHKQSFIAAFNLKDGKQAWRVERGEITSWTTPTVYEGKTRTELIVNGGRFIRGYDPSTGKELWRFADGDTQVKMQAPLVAHDLIFITGGYPAGRPMYAFRPGATGDISLKAGEETNAFLAWRTAKGSPYTPTPVVYGDLLYAAADNGVFSAYDAKTGALVYQERLPSSFSASPVAADGKIYVASEDGDVYVVKAGPKFELLSTNPMGEALMATPAVSDGTLYVRSQNYLYAIREGARAATDKAAK
jgi:outer membrane protein assembly factor BamB